MLQPKIQPSDGLSFRTCSVFIFMVLQSVGEMSQLICPHQPIVALAGDDVILPCHLEPAIDVRSETVVWVRTDLDPKYIHFHKNGRPVYRGQNLSFKNRTALFVDELKNGNVSMKISKVKISDTGKYFCILRSIMESPSIQLTVGVVSTPVIEFVSNKSREVVLQCEAKGCYPEPEVFWLDGEGNLLSAGPPETVRGPDDLYTVSRRLTVEKSDSFTCRVQQKNINQTRETHIYVPAHFFRTSSQFALILSITIIISVGFLGVMLRLLWLKCKPMLGEGGSDWRTSNQHQMSRRQKMRRCFEHGLKPPKVTKNNQEVAEKNNSGNLCDTGRSHVKITCESLADLTYPHC